MRAKIPARELLTYIEIKDGVLCYAKKIPHCHMEAGDAVTVTQCNGKPHYQISGAIYNPRKLIQAVQNQDPTYLIEKSAKPKRITARDLEMYEMLKRGDTYVDVGARYDLSRQRVKQIINKP
jgi:DNA-binding NarL/FixJ family response regulator